MEPDQPLPDTSASLTSFTSSCLQGIFSLHYNPALNTLWLLFLRSRDGLFSSAYVTKSQPCSIATPDPHTQGTEMDPSLQPVPSRSQPCFIVTPDPHTQSTEMDPSLQPVSSNSQQVRCSTAVQDAHTSGTGMDCTKHPAGLLGNNATQLAPKQRSPESQNPRAMISMCSLSSDSGQPIVMESPQGETHSTHNSVGLFSKTQITHHPVGLPSEPQITHPVWLPSDTHKSHMQDTQNEHPDARTLSQKHQESDVYLAGMSCRIPGVDNLEVSYWKLQIMYLVYSLIQSFA